MTHYPLVSGDSELMVRHAPDVSMQVSPVVVRFGRPGSGRRAEPKPVGFWANVTRFEEVSPMRTLSTLGAPLSSRSRD
jgi:hypothetical protein